MNVHVVCRDWSEDKVLPRLARYLAEGNGWTLSASPEASADLNYFIIYIDYAERFSDWHMTPVAAYFSHYDPDDPYRKLWWQTAQHTVDICTVTSPLAVQHLDGKKPVVMVTPPIDPQFAPDERKANERTRVGFSGFIDIRSRRKGAELANHLRVDLGKHIDFVASGQGWPVMTKLYPWEQLPNFYNSLDLFVCTASIEGIPMPPLEALACGVPVVIPQGVGMLDELDISPGIYRYWPAGQYDMLLAALQSALAEPRCKPGALAQVVSRYTPQQWCKDHAVGFEQAEHDHSSAPVTIESDRHGGRGVVYVAYGGPARKCAQAAIASFKQYMPEVPVALVSDVPLGCEDIFIQHADEDIGGRSAKTLIDTLAPAEWEYVMYLDADTEVVADISYLFQLVEDGFDAVICKNPGKYHTSRQMLRSDNRDECEATFNSIGTDELIQLNGGVFVFQRNPRTHEFFTTWHTEWKRWGKRDQAALLRALFAHPLKLMVLGNEWNTITRYDPPETSAGILHYPMTARRWRGVLHGRSDSAEAWKAVQYFEGLAAH